MFLFGCIEKNIGDDLFLYLICKRYPEVDFVISEDANYGTLKKLENLSFSKELKTWQRICNMGEKSNWKSAIAHIVGKVYAMICLPRLEIGVTIVGNAFKCTDYQNSYQIRWFKERINLTEKHYLLSTNFGPYKDEQWMIECQKVFSMLTDACFRDTESYHLFEKLKVSRCKPDAVISYGRHMRKAMQKVVISVIDCEFQARSNELHVAKVEYERLMAECAEYYAQKGYEVVLLDSNKEQDRTASERIKSQCKHKNVQIQDYDGNLSEIFELYETTEKIIATRLHTIVLAWLYDIPVVPIVYDLKVEGLLKMCMFNGEIFDIKELNEISVNELGSAFDEYQYRISDEVIQQANKQFEKLDMALDKVKRCE